MTEKTLITQPPSGLTRWLLRLPIALYHLKLGWLLGERFVLLHHVGRKSGQVYETVVEIVGHSQSEERYYIVAGWGHKAQWYQNLMATPDIEIQIASRHLVARAETLRPDEGADVLVRYRNQHPMAARELSRVMGINIARTSPTGLIDVVRDSLPVVALKVRYD
ncbi:MAG: nitroreductase family deazaflavin-dependent oxidoreductase [Anaerolineae bacterium]|nr:nitroreductase family deazaflavin-dependent oxidoreductase [Anaerolineae bacterium]